MNIFQTSESTLLTQLAEGSEPAFNVLFQSYKAPIYSFVLKFIKSDQLADDIVQEVFIKIWENRAELKNINSFKSYLFTIAKNHSFNILKKASNQTIAIGEIIDHYKPVEDPFAAHLEMKEYWTELEIVLNKLPEQTRKIFRLCREERKTYDEVAELLGISRDAVKKHMVRSHKILKENITDKMKLIVAYLLIVSK